MSLAAIAVLVVLAYGAYVLRRIALAADDIGSMIKAQRFECIAPFPYYEVEEQWKTVQKGVEKFAAALVALEDYEERYPHPDAIQVQEVANLRSRRLDADVAAREQKHLYEAMLYANRRVAAGDERLFEAQERVLSDRFKELVSSVGTR